MATRERMTQFPRHSRHNPGEKDTLEKREKQKVRQIDVEQKRGPKRPKDIE